MCLSKKRYCYYRHPHVIMTFVKRICTIFVLRCQPQPASSFLENSNLLEPRFVEDLGVGPMPLWIDRFARTLHDGREAYRRGVQDESETNGSNVVGCEV